MRASKTVSDVSTQREIMTDSFYALKAWRIWLYMGIQDVRNQFRRSRLGVIWLLINLSLISYLESFH